MHQPVVPNLVPVKDYAMLSWRDVAMAAYALTLPSRSGAASWDGAVVMQAFAYGNQFKVSQATLSGTEELQYNQAIEL